MGLAGRTEADADRFFVTVLGLTKAAPKVLPKAVSDGLFGVAADLTMIDYTGAGVQFEVFIDPHRERSNDPIVHACLSVADRESLLTRCESQGLKVARVPKGDNLLTFVRDYDGNLYEIKQG
jgi:catechol 2,3-dioxygenase-like lactoylglutathione lyase family enzyme